ncbi:Bcr/CflA family drug resistance efflux transporter [Betaproteobacteria bacterium]|nr:Bcr/CflA family drug resistance efflux transporter [Betaproteobacteria bacterium]
MSLTEMTGASGTPSRRRLVLILASLAAFGPLATDMYLPALPEMTESLGADDAAGQLTISVFLAGVAVSQLFYGPLSDRIGRRGLLLFGTALFALASAGCCLAWNVQAMLAFRLLMALGGAAGMVLSRAVVRDLFSGRDMADFFSLLMIVMGAAPILAPLIGGQILLLGNWRMIFAVLVIVSAAACFGVWRLLPESLPPEKRQRHGIGLALVGYWQLLRNRAFLGYALLTGFNSSAFFTYLTCSPHVFIKLNGMSEQMYAALFGLNAIGMLGASVLNRRLLRSFSPGAILGTTIYGVLFMGILLATCAWTGLGGLWLMAALLFVTLASGGLVLPNATTLALIPCGREAGSASAFIGTLQYGMGGLAGAIAGHLGADSALPMCGMFAVCSLAACVVLRSFTKSLAMLISQGKN